MVWANDGKTTMAACSLTSADQAGTDAVTLNASYMS